MRLTYLVCLLVLAGLSPDAAARACNAGVVFEDSDGDGRRDRGEPALAGVQVSDGRRIVRTDAQGRWSLPLSPDHTVFVIKPASHDFPKGADGLPRFWRHVVRDRQPALRHGGRTAGAQRTGARAPKAPEGGGRLILLPLVPPIPVTPPTDP